MSKPKLTYFDLPISRGEECRLAFVAAGVEFEDNRLTRDEWHALKPSTPFGSLPVLEVEGKPMLAQSNAILTYIGESYGLLPKDTWEKAHALSFLSAGEDLRAAVSKTFGIKDEEALKAARATLCEGPVASWGKNIEAQIRGPFACGEQLTVADLKIFLVAGWLEKGILDHIPTDSFQAFPKLQALMSAVRNHPKIAAWYA